MELLKPVRTRCFRACRAALVGLGSLALFALSAFGAARTDKLCPNRIASLMPVPGNLDALTDAERIEIRQCPVDLTKSRGTFQLVAWGKSAIEPGLIFETEDSGFYQFSMINGVYVMELIGGRAQRVIVVQFENGKPRLALDQSSRGSVSILSSQSKITVEIRNTSAEPIRFEFNASPATPERH